MRKTVFYLNLTLIMIALIFVTSENVFGYDLDCSVGFLVFLGGFQVLLSIIYTIYAAVTNKYLLALFLLYWLFVVLFFKILISKFFFTCIIIAIYNLYVNYCSYSESKFNILKK